MQVHLSQIQQKRVGLYILLRLSFKLLNNKIQYSFFQKKKAKTR